MKRMVLLFLLCLSGLSLFSQTIIENPGYAASTADNVAVTRIELRDTCTILHFRVTDPAGQTIRIPRESYIQPGQGGEKLIVTHVEGAALDTAVTIPENGELLYRLFFPGLDSTVKQIDFGEGSSTGTWFIYNLELVPVKHVSLFPEAVEGNWFRTDGSCEWVYGFLEKMVICKGTTYPAANTEKKGEIVKITVKKGTKQLVFYVKPAPDGHLLIGTDPLKMELFSRVPLIRKDYNIIGDSEFQIPVFKRDTAIYKGYLKGYLPKLGKTGMVYVDDILANDQLSYVVEIAENGTFEVKVPMNCPQSIYVDLVNRSGVVFLEPGKTTFHFMDLSGHGSQPKTAKSLFMGDCARVNADLLATEPIRLFSFDKVLKNINAMTAMKFRDWMLEVRNRELDSLNRFIQTNPICKKALQIRRMGIPYRAYGLILSYNMYRENGTADQSSRNAKPAEKPDSTFYSFMSPDDLNNQLSLVTSGEYNSLINRILFADFIRPGSANIFKPLKDSIGRLGIALSDKEKEMMDSLASGLPLRGAGAVSKEISDTWKVFAGKHTDLISSISFAQFQEGRQANLKHYFGLNPGLVTDMMFSQTKMGQMKAQMKPFSNGEIVAIKESVISPYIIDYLLTSSRVMGQKILAQKEENKKKTGYFINDVPKVKADSIFNAILAKYPGKVIFVDFWATWCSPCKEGIARMKPLKEEYLGKDIVFVYITDPSSPQKTYDLQVPDIKGQHYRLDKDGWNYLASRYKISGIPRYMLIDKTGKMVNDDLGSVAHSNEELKKLLDEYLNN